MELIRQVLEGEGLGHGSAGSIVATNVYPFRLHANGGHLLMPPRAPGVYTHEVWKGMAQPVGLVVEPVVLNRLGIFPESATTVLADWQHGVALRLVVAPRGESSGHLTFLLYAEDEELMPTDSRYDQHYSVGGLAQRLRQDRADYQNAMEGRRGAWATLLSLFGLVYDGGGSSEAYLPARHWDLFDPESYPFLEGRTADTAYSDGPLVLRVGRSLEIGGIQHGHRPVAGPAAQGDHSNQEH